MHIVRNDVQAMRSQKTKKEWKLDDHHRGVLKPIGEKMPTLWEDVKKEHEAGTIKEWVGGEAIIMEPREGKWK